MTAKQDFRYRPDIDALRAFAVLPVVLSTWAPAGYPAGSLVSTSSSSSPGI